VKLNVDAEDVLAVAGEGCAPDETLEALKRAMIECNSRLNTLSMALTGSARAQVCIANNFLNRALGRTEHYVADNWTDNER